MQNLTSLEYNKNAITTVERRKLVVLLYEGAINFLKRAQQGIREDDPEKRHNNIMRALDIIDELRGALSFSQGGEIAPSLNSLYLFMRRHLTSANMKNDLQMIQEVETMLASLNEAWKAVATDPDLTKLNSDYPQQVRGITA